MAAQREKGFYASLNSMSSVDMLPQIVKRRRVKGRGRLWEVERLIAQRQNATISGFSSGTTEFLVLWRVFSPYESTWELEENISDNCVRLFKNPVVNEMIIFSEVTTLRVAVERHLKSKSRLPVTINFRGDVYRILFKDKGIQDNNWQLLDRGAFPKKFFPQFWDHCADSHGQGIKVFYPMKARPSIAWSPKNILLEKAISHPQELSKRK
ncbi:uncharacterized protein [Montipora capricornis]|uniref:uncharacterized protein n=1 Tax=Montipora capricornis TaxID=246305 RepID=UPI0035F21374